MTTISDIYHASVRDSRSQSYPSWDREADVEHTILTALRTLTPETPRHAFIRRLVMKLVREWHSPKLDNLVDIVGYTECQFSRFRPLYEPPAGPEPHAPKPGEAESWSKLKELLTKPPVPVDPTPTPPTFPDTDQNRFDEMLYTIKRTSLRSFSVGKYNEQGMFFHQDDVTVRECDGEWFFDIGSLSFDFQDLISYCRFHKLTINIDDLRQRKQAENPSLYDVEVEVERGLAGFWGASTTWTLPTGWIELSPILSIRLINPDLVLTNKEGWPPAHETLVGFNIMIRNLGIVIDRAKLPTT